ncbi:hypothetical protein Lalb_Chr15g0078611 [Lupinus albus]|uniref:Uncharacterized protein n=1 Tax=Lupinus albus TaxID=3870 RepID=A0A6A4P8J1_LUPAL|nr:hypothetical protein Lalb_Chr15g0078611 [Lupinus albus]
MVCGLRVCYVFCCGDLHSMWDMCHDALCLMYVVCEEGLCFLCVCSNGIVWWCVVLFLPASV